MTTRPGFRSLLGRLSPAGRAGWVATGIALVIALASGLVLSTASWSSIDVPWADDRLPEGAVMQVGDRVVQESELETRLASLEALYGVVAPEDPDEVSDFKKDAAKSLAVSLIIEAAAAERDIAVSDKQAQAELAKIISDQLGGDRAAFVDYLGSVGLSEVQVTDEIKRTLVNQRLYADVTKDVPPATKEEALAEYESRREEMREPEKRRLSNIVVKTEAEAQAIVNRLKAGTSFVDAARSSSLDKQTQSTGGDLGVLTENQLDPAYAAVAFAAERGAIFGPVQTQYGWNVGKVTALAPGARLTYDQVADALLEGLTAEAALEDWRTFMRKALADADVVYADEYRPDDPDSLPSDLLAEQGSEEAPAP
jgi:peptidyl-prolyl cis-trans isomerase C